MGDAANAIAFAPPNASFAAAAVALRRNRDTECAAGVRSTAVASGSLKNAFILRPRGSGEAWFTHDAETLVFGTSD